MSTVRFLQTSDLCLGGEPDDGELRLSASAAAKRREEERNAVERLVAVAREEEVDLVLVPGDLLDGALARREDVAFLMEQVGTLAPVPVVIAPGRGDRATSTSPYRREFLQACRDPEWPSNVHLLGLDGPEIVKLAKATIGVLPVYGVHYEWKPALADPDIDILLVPGLDEAADLPRQELAALGFDYCALGGFRQRVEMRVPSPVVHEGILAGAASGSPFARRAADRGERTALVGELTKVDGATSVHLRPVRIDARKLVWIDVEVSDVPGAEDLLRRVREAIHTSGAVEDDLVEVRVRGTLHPDARMDHPELEHPEKHFHCRVDLSALLPAYPLEELASSPTSLGRFVSKLLARTRAVSDGEEKLALRNAIFYGLDAMRGGELRRRYE